MKRHKNRFFFFKYITSVFYSHHRPMLLFIYRQRSLVCSLTRLLACSFARFPPCSLAVMLACSVASWLTYSLAPLLACSLVHLLAGSLACLLTSSCVALLEKLIVSQLVKKFPALYGTRKFITAFTSARNLSLSWARAITVDANKPNQLTVSWHTHFHLMCIQDSNNT